MKIYLSSKFNFLFYKLLSQRQRWLLLIIGIPAQERKKKDHLNNLYIMTTPSVKFFEFLKKIYFKNVLGSVIAR